MDEGFSTENQKLILFRIGKASTILNSYILINNSGATLLRWC